MERNSMIEIQAAYQTPGVVEIAFKFGGPLCKSPEVETGGNNAGYGEGDGLGDGMWD